MARPVTRDCVGVVEDDAAVRGALRLMLEGLGMEVRLYATARDYLDDEEGRSRCACLVLDVRLPGISGIELQKQLLKEGRGPAIVFITGHADVQMAVEAMRRGAVDFLQKPFQEQQLLDSVQRALALEHGLHEARERSDVAAARQAGLTPREHEVLTRILRGLRTREIASELGIATRTAEEHRANVMHKLHAGTIAELVQLCTPTP
jgi:FixJ family two-component response regulator